MSYLDRYLGTSAGTTALLNKREFQLASICAFNLAVKLFESRNNRLSFDDLSKSSGGAYTVEQMRVMERNIIVSLQWRLHPPTAMRFVHHFLDRLLPLMPPPTGNHQSLSWKAVVLDVCRCQMEYVVGRYFFVTYNPSLIAAASLWNTMEL